jgi:hypothetical protein
MFNFSRKFRKTRRSMLQQAWLCHESEFATRHCTLLDMSEGGAKLWVEDADFVGRTIRLKFSPSAAGRQCRVAWRNGNTMGLEYLPAEKSTHQAFVEQHPASTD